MSVVNNLVTLKKISLLYFLLLLLTSKSFATMSLNFNEMESLVVRISGVELKIHFPESPYDANQLAIYLHGDNAKGHDLNWYNPLKEFITNKGVVFVSALSPNKKSWWSNNYIHFDFYQDDLDKALTWLHEQLPNLRRDKYLFGGVSGGATFLASVFIPTKGDKYPGVYALMCGGSKVVTGDLHHIAFPSKYNIHYEYGSMDFLKNTIAKSISDYRKIRNFKISEKIHNGSKHCAFATNKGIEKTWKKYINPKSPESQSIGMQYNREITKSWVEIVKSSITKLE